MIRNGKISILIFFVVSVSYTSFYFTPNSIKSSFTFYSSQDKLWAHQILNAHGANNMLKNFKGVELDISYKPKKDIFDIHHNLPESGLTLNQYFSQIKEPSKGYYWFDFQNLSDQNVEGAIVKIEKIATLYGVKERIIIESKKVKPLSKFDKKGFATCYWVPSFNLFSSIFDYFEVKKNLEKYLPSAISCNQGSVHFYSSKFPNYNLHCWTNGLVEESDKEEIIKLSEQKNVKIILTDFEYNFINP